MLAACWIILFKPCGCAALLPMVPRKIYVRQHISSSQRRPATALFSLPKRAAYGSRHSASSSSSARTHSATAAANHRCLASSSGSSTPARLVRRPSAQTVFSVRVTLLPCRRRPRRRRRCPCRQRVATAQVSYRVADARQTFRAGPRERCQSQPTDATASNPSICGRVLYTHS